MQWNRFIKPKKKMLVIGLIYLGVLTALSFMYVGWHQYMQLSDYGTTLEASNANYAQQLDLTQQQLATTSAALSDYLRQDQYLINQDLTATISAIQKTYNQAAQVYQDLLDLKTKTSKTSTYDEQYATVIKLLSDKKYTQAQETLTKLAKDISAEEAQIASSFSIPASVPSSNTPPGSGYARQQVSTDVGTFMVSLVSADLNSTRVIVDTASEETCGNDCPVLPLGDYVSRSGGFAGVNGPYFCPAIYPSCAGKTNSFDTLIMNKQKVYFNSDNNVYSNVPAVIFSGSGARFVGHTSEWGRSTDPDSVIAAQPFLVSGGNVVFDGDGDPKKGSLGPRGFIGVTNSTVYIGIVHNATVAESAHVLAALGIQNALNLDGGGSAALWSGGYKVGPGRALPFGIVLVRK